MSETANPDKELSEGTAETGCVDVDSARSADSSPPENETESEREAEYRLADPEPPAVAPVAPPPSAEETGSTFQASTDENEQPLTGDFPDEPPEVREVWSRWAEWKEPVLWIAGGLAIATLIMFGGPWLATLVFLAGLSFGAYYIVISLEVPVRLTPEQAVREFYAAASHRLPHFHRMYALLTSDGKHTDEFADFADFRAYWKAKIARLSRSPVWLVPLEFRIECFEYRYNGEKSMAVVWYILQVSPRGRPESDEPTAKFELRNLTVKGPDGQWYLNDGTLHEPS